MTKEKDETIGKTIDEQNISNNNGDDDVAAAERASEEILEKVDAGHNFRKKLPAFWRWFVFAAAVLLSLFQLYTAIFGTLPSNQQRGFHVAIAMGLIFLLYPGNRQDEVKVTWKSWIFTVFFIGITGYLYSIDEIKLLTAVSAFIVLLLLQISKYFNKNYLGIPLSDIILSIIGFGTGLYQFFAWEGIVARVGMYSDIDYLVASAGVLVVLGASRRVVGVPIVAVAVTMLAYAYLGPYMPLNF